VAAEERKDDRKKRRKVSASTLLAAGMLGLAEALEGKKKPDDPVITEAAPGGDGDPIDVFFDTDDPTAAFVILRPWLLR
jgi:hypothetical protein